MRRLDDIFDSMDMSLSKMVKDREAWRAAVHGIAESDMIEWLNNNNCSECSSEYLMYIGMGEVYLAKSPIVGRYYLWKRKAVRNVPCNRYSLCCIKQAVVSVPLRGKTIQRAAAVSSGRIWPCLQSSGELRISSSPAQNTSPEEPFVMQGNDMKSKSQCP